MIFLTVWTLAALLFIGNLHKVSSQSSRRRYTAKCNPDPHFRTFDGTDFDYQSSCDLILIDNPRLNLLLHIRTKEVGFYSTIDKAALRIGTDLLEVRADRTFSFNGSPGNHATPPDAVGGYPLDLSSTSDETGDVHEFKIMFPEKQFIQIQNWYNGMNVEASVLASHFSGSKGMLGTLGNPGLIGRNGITTFDPSTEGDEFAFEWQVNGVRGDALLFSDAVRNPLRCPRSPNGRDCNGIECDDLAVFECFGIADDGDRANCEFDIRTTGDVTWAQNPAYIGPFC